MTNPEGMPPDVPDGAREAVAGLLNESTPTWCCQEADAAGWGDDDTELLVEIDAALGGEDQ